MNAVSSPALLRFLALLTVSNVFMNLAWYGHLKFKGSPLWIAILASWGLAFFEYCFQVPGNRIGSGVLSVFQLKILQEVISLPVFIPFAVFYMNQPFRWDYIYAALCMVGAVYFMFRG